MFARILSIAAAVAFITGLLWQPPVRARQAAAQGPLPIIDTRDISTALTTPVGRQFVPGEVVVRRQPDAVLFTADQMGPIGLGPVVRTTSGGEVVYRVSANIMRAMSAQERTDRTLTAVAEIQRMPGVVYAQPNYLYRPLQTNPNDPGFAQQWHYQQNGAASGNSPGGISLPNVWDTNKGNRAVVVAVLDTGILSRHPDIVGSPNLIRGYDMISDPFVANDGGGRDDDPEDPGDGVAAGECGPGRPSRVSSWHGSHVAGTIGVGNSNNMVGVSGINWNARIMPVRVLGKCGGSTSDIIDAIRWAAGLPVPGVVNNGTPARVINMSLGGAQPCLGVGGDPAMQSAINDAVKANATVVVAAGNEATDASQASPAGCDNVITVAASDYRGHFVSRYSNFGSKVEIMAPGGDMQRDDNRDKQPDGVLSLTQGGYAFNNGTSMAAPHVAGVAALLVACDSKLTPAEILKRIQVTAIRRGQNEGCPAGHCGAGLLNAKVAIGPACGS